MVRDIDRDAYLEGIFVLEAIGHQISFAHLIEPIQFATGMDACVIVVESLIRSFKLKRENDALEWLESASNIAVIIPLMAVKSCNFD